MHIKPIIAAFAVMAFASSTAMAQAPEAECRLCQANTFATINECKDIPLDTLANPQLDKKYISCFCKFSHAITSADCADQCPPDEMSAFTAARLTVCLGQGGSSSNAQGENAACGPLSVPKAGAVLVAAAAALQVVL